MSFFISIIVDLRVVNFIKIFVPFHIFEYSFTKPHSSSLSLRDAPRYCHRTYLWAWLLNNSGGWSCWPTSYPFVIFVRALNVFNFDVFKFDNRDSNNIGPDYRLATSNWSARTYTTSTFITRLRTISTSTASAIT